MTGQMGTVIVGVIDMGAQDDDHHLKKIIEEAWNSRASIYDQTYGHGLRTDLERRAWLTHLERLLPPERPLRVLDVGCGTGFLSLLLAELGHDVVGLDLTEGMLEVLARKSNARELGIRAVRGDAEDPPAGLGSFDVVISRHLLWTLLQPERAVRAWTALTTPGGRVVAIDILGMQAATTRARLSAACGQLIQNLTESSESAMTSLRRALRTLVGPGDPHYPAELASRLPLQMARDLDPVRTIWLRSGLEQVKAETLSDLDDIGRAQMPAAVRMQHTFRWYLIEGRRPATTPAGSAVQT